MGGGGGPTLKASLSRAQNLPSGTTVTTATQSVAFFGLGDPANDTVDTFNGNNDLARKPLTYEGIARSSAAATNITCGNDSYALFGGGGYEDGGSNVYSNDVDIFKCNDNGIFYHNTIQFNGPPRYRLAATTVKVDGKEYALFAGGIDDSIRYDTIDIYDCETEQFLPL